MMGTIIITSPPPNSKLLAGVLGKPLPPVPSPLLSFLSAALVLSIDKIWV